MNCSNHLLVSVTCRKKISKDITHFVSNIFVDMRVHILMYLIFETDCSENGHDIDKTVFGLFFYIVIYWLVYLFICTLYICIFSLVICWLQLGKISLDFCPHLTQLFCAEPQVSNSKILMMKNMVMHCTSWVQTVCLKKVLEKKYFLPT